MQHTLSSVLSRSWQRVADREAARLRDAFVSSEFAVRPVRAWLGQSLAVLVLLGYLALMVLGVWWLLLALGVEGQVVGFGRGFCAAGGLALLVFAWMARPRFGQVRGTQITAEQTPQLHALMRQVAEALNVPVPGRVALVADVNASMGRTGWRGTPTLTLGLGLWFGLRPQERVSVIAHELAHLRNGDPTRGWLVWTALMVLGQAVTVLTPDGWMDASAQGMEVVSNSLMRVVSWLPLSVYTLLLNLVGAQQQTAEFRADLMSAQVAGSAATLSSLDRLHLGDMLESALHKQRYQPESAHAFLELRRMWDAVTPERWAQAREERAAKGTRLDDSHPPTADRLRVVEAWPREAQVILTDEVSRRLDKELDVFVHPLEQAAIEDHRYRMLG